MTEGTSVLVDDDDAPDHYRDAVPRDTRPERQRIRDTSVKPTLLSAVSAVSLMRQHRQRCSNCKRRRVLYFLAQERPEERPAILTPKLCAECSGIR